MIKVISEYGNQENQALLLSLPNELLDQLEIMPDGTVIIASLLHVIAGYHQETQSDRSAEEWMSVIMNESKLPDFKPVWTSQRLA